MKALGFTFGNNSILSIYHDGQGRDDVKPSLSAYVQEMIHELRESVSNSGDDMMTEVEGELLKLEGIRESGSREKIRIPGLTNGKPNRYRTYMKSVLVRVMMM